MKVLLLLVSSLLLIGGCESAKSKPVIAPKEESPVVVIEAQPEPLKEVVKDKNLEAYKKLIFNTKLSISSKQPNWVLFSNGTYIIFPKGTSKEDMCKTALGLLQRYNNESFIINKSPLAKGWLGSSTKGIYNYIAIDQASSRMASTKELASISKRNVIKDKENPVIVHLNTFK